MRREWIEMSSSQPQSRDPRQSPSMRREWIEMSAAEKSKRSIDVTLHAEGVD